MVRSIIDVTMAFFGNGMKIIQNMILTKIWKVLVSSKRLCFTHRRNFGLLTISSTLIVTICLSVILYFTIFRENVLSLQDTHRIMLERLQEKVMEEKGMGCNMPELNPFSEEAMSFEEYVPKVNCTGIDWVNCYKSECFVVKEILRTMKNIVCNYRDIVYVNDQIYFLDNPVKVIGSEKYILNRSDHVKVSCAGRDVNSLSILSSRWYGYKAGFRPVQTKPLPPGREDSFNVLILGFDSTSHNGFIRKMPKSYKYLSEEAVILNSYNIIGDGTSPALFAILTGRGEDEQPESRRCATKNKYVDDRFFIFHLLKGYGYRTAYFEDMPWIGSFQFRNNGFRRQPADHYLRAFFMEEAKRGLKMFKSINSKYCIGAIPQYQMMMNLAEEFLQLDGKKYCFTFIADISHDNFNMLSIADDGLVTFIQNLVSKGILEDTLVIVMGDHGTRYNGVRDTYQGKLEERLPLMAILLPEKLKRLRPDALAALKHNKDVLTTPFDIYTTVLDVLDLNHESCKFKIPGSDYPRALSLLNPIPKSRSCAEAGVMPHWCACIKWYNVSQTDPIYNQVASVIADFIDSITNQLRSKCARRILISVEWVLQQNVDDQLLKYKWVKERDRFIGNPTFSTPRAHEEYYQAKIVMAPGRSVFEGTVMYKTDADVFLISQNDISRVNAYGDEPSCIGAAHRHLNKYCYCKDRLLNYTAVSKDYNDMLK